MSLFRIGDTIHGAGDAVIPTNCMIISIRNIFRKATLYYSLRNMCRKHFESALNR